MYGPNEKDGTFTQIANPIYAQLTAGNVVFLKWTCPACGERVTSSEPLKLVDHPEFPDGSKKVVAFPPGYTHTEKDDGSPCGHLVDIRTYRFNFTLIMGSGDLSWLSKL